MRNYNAAEALKAEEAAVAKELATANHKAERSKEFVQKVPQR